MPKHGEKIEAPEFADVEAFVTYCLDDERSTFTPGEAQQVAIHSGRSVSSVTEELLSYGLTRVIPQVRRVRGFRSSDHDRYFGPGSENMAGGSGWVQINGFASSEGYR